MKKDFTPAELELFRFENGADVITASTGEVGGEPASGFEE